jgi:hypothetical protein
MRRLNVLFVPVALLALTACATLVHGTTQQIGFSSSPSRAKITLDGRELGLTPLVWDLSRGQNHIIQVALDGYQPFQATVTRSISGWIWENFPLYMVPALVDFALGGAYNLSPDLVTGQLTKPPSSSALATAGGIHITFMEKPDSSRTPTGPPRGR